MKRNTRWLTAALGLAGGVGLAGSALAQSVTGTPYLSNMDPATLNTLPNALYANWAPDADVTTFTSLPTGLEVQSTGYGSLYYEIPQAQRQTLNPNDAFAILTFTVNGTAANYNWVGTPFVLDEGATSITYGGYSGSGNPGNSSMVQWNGNVVTWTVPLDPTQLADIQGGNSKIGGFNLEFDPSTIVGGPIYDVTFNSLVLSPTPEPGTCALAGLGIASLWILRRRAK